MFYYVRKHLIFLCLFFTGATSFTQPTQAELQAMQERLQKQRDSVMNDPNLKKYMNQANHLPKSHPPPSQLPATTFNNKDFENIRLPQKNPARIKNIPQRNFSLAELQIYLTSLYTQLADKMAPDIVASVNSIAKKLGNQPVKLEAAAFTAWQNNADDEALLLMTKAATLSSDDGLLLANAGAILDMKGLSDNAIPVLRTVISYDPRNVIALNNLGQAFTALGMQDSALFYFSRCLALSPKHPEANNTAGVIELKKGNKAKAQTHFENSIHGGFNLSAYGGLKHLLKEKCRIAHLIKPKVKLPEYFNQFRYKLPRQCLNVSDVRAVQEEHKLFRQHISDAIRQYQKLAKEAEKQIEAKGPAYFNKMTMDKISGGEPYLKPFQVLGGIMETEILLQYNDHVSGLQYFNTENRKAYKELEQQYTTEYAALQKKYSRDDDDNCCGEGDVSCCSDAEAFCKESNALKNKFLSRFAALNEEWQSRNLHVELQHLDNFLYWCYFSALDRDHYKARFYQKVVAYLTTLNRLAQVKLLEPCLEAEPQEAVEPEQKELKEFDCPIDVEIPFIVGKISLSCEKFSFKAGEGIVFKYVKKISGKRQSTISLGAGGGVDASWKLGPIKAGFDAGMDMSVFITFDKLGHFVDGGMIYNAGRGAGVDFTAGERIKIKKNLGYIGDEIGWRFGINSGISFAEPEVPFMKKPEEKPVNKNVKIYKPD